MEDKLTYRLPGWEALNEGLAFWDMLQQRPKLKIKIYFDSAGSIDMLTGTGSVFRGNSFKNIIYSRDANLVYALAYRGWLGKIYMLPPHTEEFIESLQFNTRLFPPSLTNEVKRQKDELWHYILETEDLSHLSAIIKQAQNHLDLKAIEELQKNPYHLFLGVYLTNHNNYWKERYKYLVDNGVLQFSHEEDYKLGDVAQGPLFDKVIKTLNKKRVRTVNNYIDAIALCSLDAKLAQYTQEGNAQVILPLFFSNQEAILETVKEIIEQGSIDNRIPFTYIDPETKKNFPIVRAASFFIIDGFVNAMRENNTENALQDFRQKLKEINTNLSTQLDAPKEYKSEFKRVKADYLEPEIHEKVMLEFFDRWWDDGGYKEIADMLELKELDSQDEIDEQVKKHIEETRNRLDQNFSGFGYRVKIIQQAWHAFAGFKQRISKNFVLLKVQTDVFYDFNPRLNYSTEVCNRIQRWVDWAMESVKQEKDDDLTAVESEVITELINGLFESLATTGYQDEQLDKLAACIGFFYFFEMNELVVKVCDEIRRQYSATALGSTDKYPNPSIALTHAAALLQGNHQETNRDVEQETLTILACVESKHKENYKVWIGLSYIYNLLWDYRMHAWGRYKFRELFSPKQFYKEVVPSKGYEYLQKAIYHSKASIEAIENLMKNDETPAKHRVRLQKYYYAINNYLFFSIFYTSPEDFEQLEEYRDKLIGISTVKEYYHEGRFSDTLARYYFRSALLAESPDLFKLDIEDALSFNKRACENNRKNLYTELTWQLNNWQLRKTHKSAVQQQKLFDDYHK